MEEYNEEISSESKYIDWESKDKDWSKSQLEQLSNDTNRFKLYGWNKGYRGNGDHHRVYRKVYVDNQYTSFVKCLLCHDYVHYNCKTGTSSMLRHLQRYHPGEDLQSLPDPLEKEYEPGARLSVTRPETVRQHRSKAKVRSSSRSKSRPAKSRPAKRSRKSNGVSYMAEMRSNSDIDDDDVAEADANDKAIKLLTGLLVKQDNAHAHKNKPIEDYTMEEIERELKEIELKKARAELAEVEIRIEERKERINLYHEVRTNLGNIAEAAKFVLDTGVYRRSQDEKNVLEEAFSHLVREHVQER